MLKSSSSKRTTLSLSACSIVAATLLLAAPVFAQEQTSSSSSSMNTGVPLTAVIDAFAKTAKKRFLIDPRVQGNIPKEGLDLNRLSYRELQAILRLHGFAVVEISNIFNVIPADEIRHLPLPVFDRDAGNIGDDDFVVKVIGTGKLEATKLVPLLRPMLPQYGHLAATSSSNSLIVIATHANIKTLEATLRALEKQPIVQPSVARSNDGDPSAVPSVVQAK